MRSSPSHYHRHRFAAEIISHCVWLYSRFALSFRDVEEMLALRGIAVAYETIGNVPQVRSDLRQQVAPQKLIDRVINGTSMSYSSDQWMPTLLKVQPVDPYSILSGYYTTLSFDISRVDAFPNARGVSQGFSDGAWFDAIVEKGDDGT